MIRTKKIDIHSHVTIWPQYCPPRKSDGLRFLSVDEQIKMHDEINVGVGVLLPIVAPECMWMNMSNEAVKYAVDQHPDRFVWFCNVDPRQGKYSENTDLEHIIGHYKSLGAKGLGELTTPLPADCPMMDNLFGACERLDMPVIIHIAPKLGDCYGIIDDLGLPKIERMLRKHPDMKLIGHSMAFWSEISGDNNDEIRNDYPEGNVVPGGRLPELLREYGNLYCDLSAGSGANALMRDPEHAARFIEEFADRIFFGADICSVKNVFQHKFDEFLSKMVDDGYVTQENYDKIVWNNAAKLLGIEK